MNCCKILDNHCWAENMKAKLHSDILLVFWCWTKTSKQPISIPQDPLDLALIKELIKINQCYVELLIEINRYQIKENTEKQSHTNTEGVKWFSHQVTYIHCEREKEPLLIQCLQDTRCLRKLSRTFFFTTMK